MVRGHHQLSRAALGGYPGCRQRADEAAITSRVVPVLATDGHGQKADNLGVVEREALENAREFAAERLIGNQSSVESRAEDFSAESPRSFSRIRIQS